MVIAKTENKLIIRETTYSQFQNILKLDTPVTIRRRVEKLFDVTYFDNTVKSWNKMEYLHLQEKI